MPTDRARARCRERLARLATSRAGGEELAADAIEALRAAIGFAFSCWQPADPGSLLATTHHTIEPHPPFLRSAPRLIALEQGRGIGTDRAIAAGRRPATTISAATRGDLARSRVWDECLRPYGIGDSFGVACRDRAGCWGWVKAVRERDDPAFEPEDVDLLVAVSAALAVMMRRAAVASEPRPQGAPPPTGIVVLDGESRETSWTPEARRWVDGLPDAARWQCRGQLPSAFYAVAGRLLADGEAAQPATVRTRVRTATGSWAVLEGARLEGAATGGAIAITVRPATAAETCDVLGRAYGLTPRERELVRHLVAGLSTRQVADRLCITTHTVKDHVKAVFRKAGVGNRIELVHRMTGAAAEP